MDLWIRSQDRRSLYCVRQLRINGLDIMCFGGELLGTYKTEERVLEVLDEIQNILMPKITYKTFDIEVKDLEFRQNALVKVGKEVGDFVLSQSNTFVYEMPKE